MSSSAVRSRALSSWRAVWSFLQVHWRGASMAAGVVFCFVTLVVFASQGAITGAQFLQLATAVVALAPIVWVLIERAELTKARLGAALASSIGYVGAWALLMWPAIMR